MSAIHGLRCDALGEALASVARAQAACDETRDTLSAQLHHAIGLAEERQVRGALLKLRRDLYQDQRPNARALSAVDTLGPADRAAVERGLTQLDDLNAATSAVLLAYQQALGATRAHFRRGLDDADFQKGLLLSSRTLFTNLARYLEADADRLGSRLEQIERGLLRYFTRAAMKATPFGRFCAIAEGQFVALPEGPTDNAALHFDVSPRTKRGYVRLNKHLYGLLWAHLKTRPGVRRSLAVDSNPTLQREAGQFQFLASLGGREVFQRIKRGAALDFVVDLIARHTGRTYGDLVAALARHPDVQATDAEAAEYVDALLRHGLLRFRSLVAEQVADWDAPLAAALANSEDPHAQRVASTLRNVRVLADRYATADVRARQQLAERIREEFLGALSDLGLNTPLPRDLPVFEDAATTATLRIARSLGVERALDALRRWITLTEPLGNSTTERATMRHFFDARYDDRAAVPLLQFYEEFYRDHLQKHLEHVQNLRQGRGGGEPRYNVPNPFGLEHVDRILAAKAALFDAMRSEWRANAGASVLHLSADRLRTVVSRVRDAHSTECRSVSIFCQLVVPAADPAAAVCVLPQGGYFVGFGKYFSRFLYMLPERMRTRVYDDNVALSNNAMLAEICGDSQFNANLHPPLLPVEISYPTGEAGMTSGQLPSAELDVVRDPGDPNSLCLVHRPTGVRVLPVDLGFQNPLRRPPLYQLLMRFTPGGAFSLPPLEPPASTGATAPTAAIVRQPRIVFDERLVLSRQRWIIPGALMPRPDPGEGDAAYLLRVNSWRRAHGIPESVYARVTPLSVAADRRDTEGEAKSPVATAAEIELADLDEANLALDDEAHAPAPPSGESAPDTAVPRARSANRGGSRDWRKPQFINFASPLLVKLFARLAGVLPDFRLELEERFPDEPELPGHAGERFSCELVLQLDAVAPRETSSSTTVSSRRQLLTEETLV